MHTVEILQNEHTAALTMLDYLERAAEAAERGSQVPAELFSDILEFLQIFVDQCHHGKEEGELFPRLRSAGAASVADRLEAEHEQGRALTRAYAEAVRAYALAEPLAGARLWQTAADYGDFLRGHIATETAELLPATYERLEAQDEALAEAFERVETERIGAGTHERLHGLIDSVRLRVERLSHAGVSSH